MFLTKDKNWIIPPRNIDLQKQLTQQLGINPLLSRLLLNRGIQDFAEARTFLWGTLADLHNPFLLKDMVKAIEIILYHIQQGHKICVYGDYDVDGLTGTALLVRVLRRLHAEVTAYIPNRMEDGYGLRCDALKKLKEAGVELVITVDCGITACVEVAYANQLGLKVIVTDHHQLGDERPEAAAIINPQQPECMYPFKKLAGVGVALKLAQALLSGAGLMRETADLLHEDLDLVALGTVADVVPLQGENRLLVKYGLKQLTNSSKSGIKALRKIADLGPEREVSVGDVAFKLAPRLNAAGRLGDADQGFQLLVSENVRESEALACKTDKINRERRTIEEKILEEVRGQLRKIDKGNLPRVVLLASEGWHVGVIGIVASRIAEEFYRPTIVISLQDGVGKGSARSIHNFHIQQALSQCSDLLEEYGGHEMAAGLNIRKENISGLQQRINQWAEQTLREIDLIPSYYTDGEISLDRLSIPLLQELRMLSPYGAGNPAPLFCVRQVQVMGSPRKVGNNHLKLKLCQGNQIIDGIGFNMGDLFPYLAGRGTRLVDVIFRPQINVWQGEERLQLNLQDMAEPKP